MMFAKAIFHLYPIEQAEERQVSYVIHILRAFKAKKAIRIIDNLDIGFWMVSKRGFRVGVQVVGLHDAYAGPSIPPDYLTAHRCVSG